jgi:hypothetical protein
MQPLKYNLCSEELLAEYISMINFGRKKGNGKNCLMKKLAKDFFIINYLEKFAGACPKILLTLFLIHPVTIAAI